MNDCVGEENLLLSFLFMHMKIYSIWRGIWKRNYGREFV